MAEIIRFTHVSVKNKNYHLLFKGYVPSFDKNKIYEFDFIGTEIYIFPEITELAQENLTKYLAKDFGYPPYNRKKVKDIFGNGKEYEVIF